jgi:C4-dicarboxylate-specific signal transduction histidine kinase
MSKTIDDFRNFFKSDKELLNFDVYKNIEKSISLVSGIMKAHGVELELKAVKKPTAKGLPNELGQVILNLISNAKDAISELKPNDPKIKITLDDDDQYAIIDVEDNGGGIKNEIIERIFEPYFTTKEEGKGTGIGLYMSKTIVENNMSGRLSVANKEKGAVFTVKIPLVTQ